ncbi:MAG: hypothetical protein U0R19_09795 [Bryobacteraceae bacterium]
MKTLALLSIWTGSLLAQSGQTVVRTFADTILERGLDRYGPTATPLWAGVIDTGDFRVPKDGVPAPAGVRPSDRALGGCNLYHDAVSLRVFHALSEQTGDEKWSHAAREYAAAFVRLTQSPATGLLGWGEHLYYDFFQDKVAVERRSHELIEWTPPWDLLWRENAEATAKAIAGIRYHYFENNPQALFNRHAYWEKAEHQPAGGQPWIKHTGLYAYSFAFLYSKTREKTWRDWALGAGSLYWRNRDAATNLTEGCIGDPRPTSRHSSVGTVYLAYWLLQAWRLMPEETELRDHAVALLDAFLKHHYDGERKAYRAGMQTNGKQAGDGVLEPWHYAYGSSSSFELGRILAFFAKDLKEPRYRKAAEMVAREAAQTAIPEKVSIANVAFALNLSLDLYDLTREKGHLTQAQAYTKVGLARFWVQSGQYGLIVREAGDRYYESKTGAGDFAAGLLRLSLREKGKFGDVSGWDWRF